MSGLWSADGGIGDPVKGSEAKIQCPPRCPDVNKIAYLLEQKLGACRRKGIEILWVQENKDHHQPTQP